ncbi:MAG: hypothetical protein ACI8V7_000192 [Candidatus Paceibacteria bacterium]|jgi:hypothetical protein
MNLYTKEGKATKLLKGDNVKVLISQTSFLVRFTRNIKIYLLNERGQTIEFPFTFTQLELELRGVIEFIEASTGLQITKDQDRSTEKIYIYNVATPSS